MHEHDIFCLQLLIYNLFRQDDCYSAFGLCSLLVNEYKIKPKNKAQQLCNVAQSKPQSKVYI